MDSVRSQEWRYREEDIGLADLMARRLEIDPILARLLVARSIMDPERAYDMLHPSLRNLKDPFLFTGMDRMVDRIAEAISNGEGITIHGDYDVDGISSTALFRLAMENSIPDEKLNHFLPSRFEEGYGLSPICIDEMVKRGDSLLITVDCGIKAVEEVEIASRMGIEVLVTDHHEPGEETPKAHTLIDPKMEGSGYPFKELAGVGVAFKVATALQMRGVIDRDVRAFLDLVALGTVADLVPLEDENRSMVYFGLEKLASTCHIGLRTLMSESGMDPRSGLRSSDIAFKLGPRLNSAGRLAHPGMALDLLLTRDRVDAELFARELNTLNYKRQSIGKKLVEDILSEIEARGLMEDPAVVVAKEGWNPGVIGVSASRLVDLTGKPTVILTIEGEEARGSARAPRGFNMVEALQSMSHLLEKHGGHESAAGLTIKTGNISKLQEDLSRFVDEHYPDHTFTPVIEIDLDLTPEELGIDAVGSFDLLGPYGMGNPQPLISVRDVMIGHDIKTVGSGKHLKFSISDNGHDLSCIWFNMGEQIDHLPPGTMVNLAGFPEIHSWGGRDEVQIRVNDMFING